MGKKERKAIPREIHEKQAIRLTGNKGVGGGENGNEPVVAQNSRGTGNSRRQLAEGQEPHGGHSWLQFKLWVSQAVGRGGANSHALGMKPSVAAPVTRVARAKLE